MIAATVSSTFFKQYQRNVFLLLLLVVVPFVFITLAFYKTADQPLSFFVTEGGHREQLTRPMPEVHAAIMVPITVAFLAGIVGLFIMLDAVRSDSRLLIAGVSPSVVAGSRLAITVLLVAIITLVSIGVTMMNFVPGDAAGFIAGNFLIAVAYAFIGAILALLAGRLGGAYLMFFIPMIDAGIFQDPMFISGDQAFWMRLFPGFGGTRMVLDAGFTGTMDDWTALAAAVAWAVALGAAVVLLYMWRPARG